MHLPLPLLAIIWTVEYALCIFNCNCKLQNGQWNMHCASSTATAGDKMGSGRCMVHLPLPLRATTFAVEDAWCIVNCYCLRQHGQWKMCCASSTATVGDNMGSGRCIVQLLLPLLATTWAVEDARCIFNCNCGRQHVQWTMHGTSSTATAGDKKRQWKMQCASSTATVGDNICNRRCTVHRPLQLRATTWAVGDALCIFHRHCGRQHMHRMPSLYPSSTHRLYFQCPF